MCTLYWGLQTEEQCFKLVRIREVNNNLVVYGSSKSLDQRFINPRTLIALFTVEVMWESKLSLRFRRTPKSFTEYIRSRDMF